MGRMSVLFGNKNENLFWDVSVPEEVAAARLRFEEYIKKGYIACRIEKDGNRGVHIVDFDPKAEEIMLVLILEGG